MQTHEFVSAVQESARIDDHAHAEQAVRATLTVLGQRLGSEAQDLAAQLPAELAEALPTDGSVERFELPEFYDRVAQLEGRGCSAKEARQHARAVVTAIREAVGEEYLHVLDQLPGDYGDLTSTEPVVH